MPNGPGGHLAGEVWGAFRPKPGAALKSIWSGIMWGASVGGITGSLPGAAIGAGAGVAIGTVAGSAKVLIKTFERLEKVTKGIVDVYAEFSPAISHMKMQWELLDKQINRAWADAIEPTLKKLSIAGMEFKKRWEDIKVNVFQAFRPWVDQMVNWLSRGMRTGMVVIEFVAKRLEELGKGAEIAGRVLGLLSMEYAPGARAKDVITPKAIQGWPVVEHMIGAMQYEGVVDWPQESSQLAADLRAKRQRLQTETEEEQEQRQRRTQRRELQQEEGFLEPPPEGKGAAVNVNVNVSDSAELAAAFKTAWDRATSELRNWEGDNMFYRFRIQEQGAFV